MGANAILDFKVIEIWWIETRWVNGGFQTLFCLILRTFIELFFEMENRFRSLYIEGWCDFQIVTRQYCIVQAISTMLFEKHFVFCEFSIWDNIRIVFWMWNNYYHHFERYFIIFLVRTIWVVFICFPLRNEEKNK